MPRRNVRTGAATAAVSQAVKQLGGNIAVARKRRRWRQIDLAAKAGVAPLTVNRIEAGQLGTGIGAVASVLWALGMLPALTDVASPSRDPEGETLAFARETNRVRPSRVLSDEF